MNEKKAVLTEQQTNAIKQIVKIMQENNLTVTVEPQIIFKARENKTERGE